MTRKSKIGKGIGIFLCVIAFAGAFTFIVMSLWNAVLPAVLGVKTITFWQALGILILSKILFGGFGSDKGGPWKNKARARWRDRMMNKWENMSPEEREKFKSSWEARCGSGSWRRPFSGRRFEGFDTENKETKSETKGEAGAE